MVILQAGVPKSGNYWLYRIVRESLAQAGVPHRSFVAELSDGEASSRIVEAIISLGNGLDMPVTAEGIEDDRILGTLKTLGQMKGQGYHYGRPENIEAVRKRLAQAGLLIDAGPVDRRADGGAKDLPAAKSA